MIVDPPRSRALKVARKASTMASLSLRSRGQRQILGDAPVVVSLTSYGARLDRCGYTIEAIARSQVLPQRFILWVSDEGFALADYPHLARLKDRGLEIIRCPDYGPYKKSYPYASQFAADGLPMITADDDVFYPADWLATLVTEQARTPEVLVGLRGHRLVLEGEGFAPYLQWEQPTDDRPDFRVLLTGVGGIAYPVRLLHGLREAGEAFLTQAPRVDDLWVHHVALRNGIASRWVPNAMTAMGVPGSQRTALHHENSTGGRNDAVLASLYDAGDLERLRR